MRCIRTDVSSRGGGLTDRPDLHLSSVLDRHEDADPIEAARARMEKRHTDAATPSTPGAPATPREDAEDGADPITAAQARMTRRNRDAAGQ